MNIENVKVAKILNELADLDEIAGDNPFRIRAYRNAARLIENLSQSVATMITQGKNLTELPGIGAALAEKIKIIVATGDLPQLHAIEKKVPPVLSELLKVQGLGPKRIKIIYEKLHIKSVNDLKTAIEKNKIQTLPGFGEKTADLIKNGIENLISFSQRTPLTVAEPTAKALQKYLEKCPGVTKVTIAGSFRRHKETVGDLDIVVVSKNGKAVIDYFTHYSDAAAVLAKGDTRSTIRLHCGLQVDLRVVSAESYGAALLYFTGSKAHNITLRKIAQKKKLKINEYGVFKGKEQIAGKTEKEIYHLLGLPYFKPEQRENVGEIEAALKK